ncbi:hypothetical protein L5G28_00300 [Gordonia sp. HY285]|uniref:hypothetical protein n=1 Tax=Gordonia liuliyuniae TaxID=2911517 RepID=UPI001F3AECF4|nr:hypothetical protein [Gordonia liuliyuniae]MCF8608610.1 hypothetical protein [Gordonia liuliyuniae]
MTVLLVVVLVIVLLAVLGGGAFAFALVRSSKSAPSGAAIGGVGVVVPKSWAGSHDPEARLHRRIRDAVAALDATIGTSGIAQIDDRARLMVSAQELDQRLVTIWALPAAARAQPLAEVEHGVAALESAAASVALSSSDGAVGRAQDAAGSLGGYAGEAPASPPQVVPPVPDITVQQPAERRDRRDPPSNLAK